MEKKNKNQPQQENVYINRIIGVFMHRDDAECFLKWVADNHYKLGAEVGKLIAEKVKKIRSEKE